MMRYKWGEAESKYFSKKMPTAERENWLTRIIDKWFYWVVLATCTGAVVWILYRLYCLYQIQMWLESIKF